MRDAGQYNLLGFSETNSVRQFVFNKEGGPRAAPCTVIADVAFACNLKVPLQGLPWLSARLLEASGDDQRCEIITITASDLSVVAANHADARRQLTDKRARRSNWSNTPVETTPDESSATLGREVSR
jgi:hypothetical protein